VPIAHPHFTPDGKRIVYGFTGKDGVREVRTINIDGTDEQTIIKSPGYDRFQVTAISPDGKLAAVNRRRADSHLWQIGILSLQTGKLNILTDADAYVGNFSPDGRWLVYAGEVSGGSKNSAIYAIAVDGSVKNELVAQPMLSLDTPYFSPDGSKVLMVFRPGGATLTNLYSIPVADGKKLGPPQIVREGVPAGSEDWGPDVMGFTRDGAFYVSELRSSRVVVWRIENLFPQVSTKK
jgi:Tol biopolymer transport system component